MPLEWAGDGLPVATVGVSFTVGVWLAGAGGVGVDMADGLGVGVSACPMLAKTAIRVTAVIPATATRTRPGRARRPRCPI